MTGCSPTGRSGRRDHRGRFVGLPGALVGVRQRLTAAEALAIYTIGSAAACGDEGWKGRLAPGFLADFVVLDRHPLAVEPEAIADIRVLHTHVGGSRVWTRAQ
ncbi:hypothetical protein BAY59_27840 [Prauserella coralliicola]|nr:hypothetical protein BAY59_27840 [Prauserella coralliicola]